MTPLFCWVFLLALVGRAASVPPPLVNDACALVCNPGAETEGERERRERDPIQYPRYPKGVCKLQSSSDQDQARVLVSHCLKLCANELSDASELNCYVLRSSIESHLGCYCPALVPLSPNTMRLHENWRITHLVNELAQDLENTIFESPIEQSVICELHEEVFTNNANTAGRIGTKCRPDIGGSKPLRKRRTTDEKIFMDKMKSSLRQTKEDEGSIVELEKPEEPVEDIVEMEAEPQTLTPIGFNDHMDYIHYCRVACRSSHPDPECDCMNLELEN